MIQGYTDQQWLCGRGEREALRKVRRETLRRWKEQELRTLGLDGLRAGVVARKPWREVRSLPGYQALIAARG